MFNRRKPHWAALLAVGLPLLISGCAGTAERSGAPGDPAAQQAATANLSSLSLADKLRIEKNYSSAAAMYQQAHQAKPDDVRPLLGMGESFLALGANIDAANAYSAALEIDSDNADALFGLGKARLLLNQPELAVPILQAAARVSPGDPRPLTALGVAQDKVGDHAAAQQSYKAVLSLDPSNRAALNNLALSMALIGDEAGAVKILEGLNSSATASSVVRQNLALVYGVNGQLDQSERLGRVDLAESSVQQNLTKMRATNSPTDRAALLNSSLGVELKGMQYSAAQQPAMMATSPAQLPLDASAAYVAPPASEGTQVITVETTKLKSSNSSEGATTAKSVATADEWGDDWDEELVDAAELDPPAPSSTVPATAQAPQIAATPKSVDEPLPEVPLPASMTQASMPADSSAPSMTPTKPAAANSSQAAVTPPAPTADSLTLVDAAPSSQTQSVSSPAKLTTVAPPPSTAKALEAMKSTTGAATAPAEASKLVDESQKPAAPAPTQTDSTTVTTATSIAGAKVYTIQLAAYRSEAEATAGWTALTTDQSDLLNGLTYHVEKADLGADKGIFYRLKAGSFGDIAKAKALCSDLKTRAVDCMVVEAGSGTSATAPAQSKQSALTPVDRIVVSENQF